MIPHRFIPGLWMKFTLNINQITNIRCSNLTTVTFSGNFQIRKFIRVTERDPR